MKADIPQPKPEKNRDKASFKTMKIDELKGIAKERGITVPNKIKKDDLIKLLS